MSIQIIDNGDGTAQVTLPVEHLPTLKRCFALELRNERIQSRFIELRQRMKVDDALAIIQKELVADGTSLSRASLMKIVYPLPEEAP